MACPNWEIEDIKLQYKRYSLYSSSCPNESKPTLIDRADGDFDMDDCNNELDEDKRFKSEDFLSTMSNEFDQCPELDDVVNVDKDDSFEFITDDENARQTNLLSFQTPRHVRRGSDAMREFSIVILNKINRKFYSMRVGDWLKIRTKINSKVPLYLLGKKYLFNNAVYANLMGKKEFMLDFTSRFWFTYRQNFKCLPCSKSRTATVPDALRSSDCGWGCMVRSGQMLMAQALCNHFLGRNWRLTSTCQRDQAFHRQIIKWFADTPKVTSPFSIHQIIRISEFNPGDWFGPSSICSTLTKALQESYIIEPKLNCVKIYFSQDRILFRDEINDMMNDVGNKEKMTNAGDSKKNALIIFLPLFLGSGTNSSPAYFNIVNKWLHDPFCVGIIGGKPRHSIYMIGIQDKNVIYIDPHVLQDTVNVSKDTFPIETFHCTQPLIMPYKCLDPNCAVGFYCRTLEEVNIFLNKIQEMSTVYVNTSKGWRSQSTIEVLPGYPKVSSDYTENH